MIIEYLDTICENRRSEKGFNVASFPGLKRRRRRRRRKGLVPAIDACP